MDKLQQIKVLIEKHASRKPFYERDGNSDDSTVNDWAGGNIDDAYSIGMDDGQTSLAREILSVINEN